MVGGGIGSSRNEAAFLWIDRGVNMLQRDEDPERFRARMDELAGRICAAASLQAESDCQFLELVAEFGAAGGIGFWRDVKSLAHWLSWTCSIAPGTAREQVRVARSLATMPRVTAAFREGRLSYSKVRELSRVAGVIDDELLCSFGLTMTASQLARTVRGFRTSAGLRAQGAASERMTWTTTGDGMMTFKIKITADEGAHLVAAVDRAMDLAEGETRRVDAIIDIAKAYLNATPEDLSGEDRHLVVVHTSVETLASYDPETLAGHDPEPQDDLHAEMPATHHDGTPTGPIIDKPARGDTQSLADATTQTPADSPTMAGSGTGTPVGFQPAPLASPGGADGARNVPAGTLVHESPMAPAAQAARAGIRGLGGIEPATAQRLACDSDLLAAVLDRDGTVLAVSDRQRLVSRRQRRALMIRDQGMCQFPGCSRTRLLKAHHLRHWAHGGRTELENLILLCQFHHTCVHEGGMTIQPAEPLAAIRRWDFVLPDGECVRPSSFSEDQTLRTRLAWQAQRRRQEAAQRLSRVDGFHHPDARRVLPRWAGERFDLYAAVEALYGSLLERGDRAA